MKFVITLCHDEDGMFVAECLAISGCIRAKQNLKQRIIFERLSENALKYGRKKGCR